MPPLRELEAYVFEALFRHLWYSLLQHVTAEPVGLVNSQATTHAPHNRVGHSNPPSPAKTRPTPEEEAVQRWLEGLQVRVRPVQAQMPC